MPLLDASLRLSPDLPAYPGNPRSSSSPSSASRAVTARTSCGHGVVVVEGLDRSAVGAGDYALICLR